MLKEIKKELLNNPEKLKDILATFDFHNIVIHNSYISFGRAVDSSKKSIAIRLENNDFLYVTDYARNISKDLFSYISEQRRIEFSEILNVVKSVLNISDFRYFEKQGIFGGFYEQIKAKHNNLPNVYNEDVLKQYAPCCNIKFLRDNISLDSQHFFGLRYDIESQSIVIPVYTQTGQLMGVKARYNYEVEDGDIKYFYLIPCAMSKTLFGYSQNYNFLVDNTIYVFESEKSVMQCYSYGIRNCVAMGSGSISSKQTQMLFELKPKCIMLMHDVGYKEEYLERNIKKLQSYSRFSGVKIGYWDYLSKEYPDKASPSDLGEKELKRIIQEEIKMIGDEDDEEL